MIENNVTVVVGAGASKEFGLPTGAELKTSISQLLNITFDDVGRQKAGDRLLCDALRLLAEEASGHRNINQFLDSLWHIRDAMPQASSIDNFIDNHQGNSGIEICGKLGISRAILKAERDSIVHVDEGNYKNKLSFQRAENTWLNSLLKIVTSNCRSSDLEQRLSGLKFIVFNYDRCIEHFLYFWLENYYHISSDKIKALVNGMEIFHPYGTVGNLPWQSPCSNPISFGAEPDAQQLVNVARQIKTFTEGTDPASSDIAKIKGLIQNSKKLLFLGFAYHGLNLKLLGFPCKRHNQTRHIFGTAFEISDYNCASIKERLFANVMMDGTPCLLSAPTSERIFIRNDKKCNDLINEYSGGLYANA